MTTTNFQLTEAQDSTFQKVIQAQKYTPNSEQQDLMKAVISLDDNIVVSAKAGAGKTTSLKLIVEVINPKKSIALIAFNKSIVTELKDKFAEFKNVDIRTSHSLGMKVLNSGKQKITLNENKVKQAIDALVKDWGVDPTNDEGSAEVVAISDLADLIRLNLVVKNDLAKATDKELEEMYLKAEEIAEKHDISLGEKTLLRTFELISYLRRDYSQIDFVDMIYFPAIACETKKYLTFPKYDFILVDECQDLSEAQQALIKKCLAEGGRIIAVGDPNQAIYGFAGADAESFEKLQKMPNTITLPLNECFRCGKDIIEFVNKIEPDIKAFEGNCKGEVREASVNELTSGDFVMCRHTLPLVKLCFYLLARNKAAYIKGRDIGLSLSSLVKKSKKISLDALYTWSDQQLDKILAKLAKKNPSKSEEQLKEMPEYVNTVEKFDIIKIIAINNSTVNDCRSLIAAIEGLFSDDSKGICLTTVHKAKGLEAERCFVIERERFTPKKDLQDWQIVQERNIEYVCYTRAKELLGFISDWFFSENYPLPTQEAQVKESSVQVQLPKVEKNDSLFLGDPTSPDKFPMTLTILDQTIFGNSILYDMVDSEGRFVQKLGTINERYFISSNRVEFFAEVVEHKVKFNGEHITLINRVALEK